MLSEQARDELARAIQAFGGTASRFEPEPVLLERFAEHLQAIPPETRERMADFIVSRFLEGWKERP
jgi:hypothetical protein